MCLPVLKFTGRAFRLADIDLLLVLQYISRNQNQVASQSNSKRYLLVAPSAVLSPSVASLQQTPETPLITYRLESPNSSKGIRKALTFFAYVPLLSSSGIVQTMPPAAFFPFLPVAFAALG